MEKSFASKEIIFREGNVVPHAFIILSGVVELRKTTTRGEVVIATLEAGAVLAEEAALQGPAAQTCTAKAKQPTRALLLTAQEFENYMQQCPKPILPILRAHLNRAKPKTEEARAEVKPAASKPAISKIVISPASEASKQQFSDITLTAESLPFRIGGFTPGNEFLQSDQTHLHIASSGSPLIVSKNHCELSADENGLHLTDLGSRFCTVVNGVSYGRGQGKYAATLDKGANEITLGGPKSPYKITIKCS